MGRKGKGRQSGGYGSKSQRVAHTSEWQELAHQVQLNRPKNNSQQRKAAPTQRPRLTRLGQLKGILRERQSQEAFELMQRRRRAGFIPSRGNDNDSSSKEVKDIVHPPGWIIDYGKFSEQEKDDQERHPATLQSKCLQLLSKYIVEYLEAMGKEELHAALSFLPPETLSALSKTISKGVGMTNDLAFVVGKHAHVEELCFRAASTGDDTLTDEGLLELVPRIPSNETDNRQEMWEDWEELYDDGDNLQSNVGLVDILHLEGCNVRLRRLELVDCAFLSADVVLALLEKCAFITHLSLAGSIQTIEDGVQIVRAIPDLLPALQVVDVTRCNWMSSSIISYLQYSYATRYATRKPPIIQCQGCFIPEEFQEGFSILDEDW